MEQDFDLLKQLCGIFGPSGNESQVTAFLLDYIKKNQKKWKKRPKVFAGKGFQDTVMLVFGKPKTAILAHIDSIGFTVRYDNHLVPIGGPVMKTGFALVGEDSKGKIETNLLVDKKYLVCDFPREIDRGTELVFKQEFKETKDYVQSCYLDNRLGVYNALKVAETLENGIICFTTWEEHGGGSVAFLAKKIYEDYGVSQALISDITWVTNGVKPGKGVVISMRDKSIPRRVFVNKIIDLAQKSKVDFQLEVEGAGGSDGKELQMSPYPFDWVFIGAPEDNVHSPKEKVHKKDITSMIELYQFLMKKL